MFWKQREKRKEVFVTNDAVLFGAAVQALKKAGISCETKNMNQGSQSRSTGEIGKIGENTRLTILYYIYVPAEMEQEAKYVIGECQKTYEKP